MLDFGQEVAGKVQVRVNGASSRHPSCTRASASRAGQWRSAAATTARRRSRRAVTPPTSGSGSRARPTPRTATATRWRFPLVPRHRGRHPAPRRLPLPDAVPRRSGLDRRRRGLARLHARRGPGRRPLALRGLVPEQRRHAQQGLVRRRLHGPAQHGRLRHREVLALRDRRARPRRRPGAARGGRRCDLRRRQARPDRVAGRSRGPAAGGAADHRRPRRGRQLALLAGRAAGAGRLRARRIAGGSAQPRREAHLRRVRHLVRAQPGRALALHRRPRLPGALLDPASSARWRGSRRARRHRA